MAPAVPSGPPRGDGRREGRHGTGRCGPRQVPRRGVAARYEAIDDGGRNALVTALILVAFVAIVAAGLLGARWLSGEVDDVNGQAAGASPTMDGIGAWTDRGSGADTRLPDASGMAEHGALRIAHRKNSRLKMADSAGFYGIEADLQGATADGQDYQMFHDTDHGYTLTQFLTECRERGQLAVLDVKDDTDLRGVVGVVQSLGMVGDVVFQVRQPAQAEEVCSYDARARCWLLNGGGDEGAIRWADLRAAAPWIEGMNVYGGLVEDGDIDGQVAGVHAITGRYGEPLTMCIFAYGDRSDVYGLDALYDSLGVDYLSTDRLPGR